MPVNLNANAKVDDVGTRWSRDYGTTLTQTGSNNYPDWCWDQVKEETGTMTAKKGMATSDDLLRPTSIPHEKNYPNWCWDKVQKKTATVKAKNAMAINNECLMPTDIHYAALWPTQINLYDVVGKILFGDECHSFNEKLLVVHKVQARKDKFKKVGWYATADYHSTVYDTSRREQDCHSDFYRLSKGGMGWFEVFGTE